jgi:flavin-dependent dehydrogenase
MSSPEPRIDVAVVGGGPAGSTAATMLSRLGRSVVVVERERFPRFHIGESMLPLSDGVLGRLGIDVGAFGGAFVEKHGATFTTGDGAFSRDADFATAAEVPQPRTWQVLRSRFDHVLLQHARRCGATVLEGTRAVDVAFAEDGADLTLAGRDGARRTVRAGVVVDASGQAGFLSKRLGLRVPQDDLRNVAVYRHFEGVPRRDGIRAGHIQVLGGEELSWIWIIPLHGGVTSVGAVIPKGVHDAFKKMGPEEALARWVETTPAARDQMREAIPVGPARIEADFCYAPTAYAGDRWLLAGDAGSFLDPVFSTGVLLALEGGLEAADAIDEGMRRGERFEAPFRRYHRLQRRRYRFFRRFVRGFYDPAFRDLFFSHGNRFGMFRSIVTVLAGNSRPSARTRLSIELFFAAVALHRRIPLTQRRHATGRMSLGDPRSLEA